MRAKTRNHSANVTRNVRNYLAQRDESPTVTTEVYPRNESGGTRFLSSLQKSTDRWCSGGLSMPDTLDNEDRICCYYCKFLAVNIAVALHQYLISGDIECSNTCIFGC